jgi:hypothetical protein
MSTARVRKILNLLESVQLQNTRDDVGIHKVYRNSDGSATVVLESGQSLWFNAQFVARVLINENNKINSKLILEAIKHKSLN